jgi:multisubunit Na+/H+ antiporter MnhF subunit
MERLLIAGISFSIYTSIGYTMQRLVTPPSHLDRKTAMDYIGQHVSLVHGVLAIIFAITVYFIEGGIHYEADTNIYHLLVLGV